MKRFILLSLVFLGLGFYELSGGADFDPDAARAALVEARQQRDAERIAGLPSMDAAALRQPDSPATVAVAQKTDPARQDGATRVSLNLVSFEAVKRQSGARTPAISDEPVLAADPDTDLPGLEELSASRELSLAAVEPAGEAPASIVFSGNTLTASSSAAERRSDVRTVKGTLVNLRSGPGTDYDVVDQLAQGTRVDILTDGGNGWVELRPVDGGATGWIAEFLLTNG